MKLTLKKLAEMCGGTVIGDENISAENIASLSEAKNNEFSFLSNAKNFSAHLEEVKSTKAVAIIAPEDAPDLPLPSVRLKNPYLGLVAALNYFNPPVEYDYNIHPQAFVSPKAKVAPDAVIGPMAVVDEGAEIGSGSRIDAQVYIGRNAKVGSNTHINPGVRILYNCEVGNNCIIHSNTVIGSDGFGFTPNNGIHVKVPQVGNVVIEDNVEIGACVTIDRATMESTIIGEGTKTDNMIHIAHNCKIGKHCIIVAQVGMSGSTILEDYVTLAGQVGTAGHLTIGKGSTIAARGVVTSNVAPGSFSSGFPLKPHAEERKILVAQRQLPDLIKKVRELEKKIEELSK